MGIDIDSLQIEIEATSADAAEKVDSLATALTNLKTAAKGGAGLTSVVKQLNKLKEALTGISGNASVLKSVSDTLRSFSGSANGSVSALGSLSKAAKSSKVDYSSLSDEILEISKSFSELPKNVQSSASAFARAKSAMDSLSGEKASISLGEAGMALDDLRKSAEGSDAIFSTLSSSVEANKNATESIASAYASLPQEVQKAVKANSDYEASIRRLSETTKSSETDYSSLTSKISEVSKIFASLPASVQQSAISLAKAQSSLDSLSGEKASVSIDEARMSLEKLKQSANTSSSVFAKLKSAFSGTNSTAQSVASAYASLPPAIQKAILANAALETSNTKTAKSFGVLGTGISSAKVKFGIYFLMAQRVASAMSTWVKESNDYVENLNLFNVSMGEYAESAKEYAEEVQSILGIDSSEWMRNQGVFKQMASGFGVVSDDAALMSKNLTQLGYDISSFYNISIEEAMTKLQSGLAGEIEPLRRLGYAIDQASLQQVALNLGITESVASMNQAEKSQLRYIAIMQQSGNVMGDLSRTIQTPANAMRILNQQITQLSRALGNLLIPALQLIIPWVQAFVSVLTELIQALAVFFGFELPKIDYSGLGGISAGASEAEDAMNGASGAAKELKKTLLGIDELNLLAKESDSGGGGGGAGVGGGGGLGMELPEYDFLGDAEAQLNDLKERLKDILVNYVVPIGAGFAAWKIASGVLTGISTLSQMLKNLPSGMLRVGIDFKVIGLTMFLADLNELRKYIDDIANNGANFKNVAGVISEFAGTIGDAFILLGAVKIGGALKALQGIGEIVIAIKDISDNGVNWENATTAIRGLTNVAIAIGLFVGGTSGIKFAAASVAVQGMNTVIAELAENWDAIKKGDWSGVDKATLAIGAIEILGGVAVAIGKFSALKSTVDTAKATKSISDVTTATESVSTATSKLSPNLTSLAKNLGMGVVIIAEVAAAAAIFVGSIALIGYELGLVADAWTPVIDNAGTVAISVATGTGILVAIGAATYALGSAGATVALNVGIGTLVLAELGIATGLFIVEIWAIGEGLNKIGEAWQPVLDNGETIALGIALGTGLLIGIGVVTAALGVATVGSYGLLPVAIALGTAILVELAVSFVAFTESLVAVSDELSGNLAPSLANLNLELPSLKTNMSNFTDYMISFSDEVGSYTDSMGSITWSSIVDGFLKIFSGNPIGDLSDDIYIVYIDVSALNEKLRSANPEIQIAIDLLSSYNTLMTTLGQLTQGSSNIQLATEIFTNLKEAGSNLVLGFSEGVTQNIGVAYSSMENLGSQMMLGIYNSIERDKVYVRYSLENLFAGVRIRVPTFSISGGFNLMTGSVPSIRVDWFANGGFPEQGQMFIANEQGPELVGQIGNRTAVANNDQIVTAVSQGVYDANAEQNAILREQNRLLTQILEKTGVSIDGYEFANSLTKYQSDRKRALGV